MSYTPGPWRAFGYEIVSTTDNERVATTNTPRRPHPEEQANACLIAAAPELLKALHEATDTLAMQLNFHRQPGQPWEPDDEAAAQQIEGFRDLIDKAEGRG